jgi:hypothetical protein
LYTWFAPVWQGGDLYTLLQGVGALDEDWARQVLYTWFTAGLRLAYAWLATGRRWFTPVVRLLWRYMLSLYFVYLRRQFTPEMVLIYC